MSRVKENVREHLIETIISSCGKGDVNNLVYDYITTRQFLNTLSIDELEGLINTDIE